MNTKDTSNWTQLEFLNWFNQFLESEWEEYIQYAEDNGFNKIQVSILKSMQRCIGNIHRAPSFSQLRSAHSTIESVEMAKKRDEMAEKFVEGPSNSEIKHVSIRVAWHDNKWDGNVCHDPVQNSYCSGYHSLLSARLRSRKRTDLELKYIGQGINCFENEMDQKDKEYIPPCFWSINAFGDNSIEVEHDNPILSDLEHIKETLPPYSVYSWPFALSFVRDLETKKADGKYPKNLENVRIPKFQNKLQEGQTIVFFSSVPILVE